MNIPSKLLICGKEHKVIIDKESSGGWFDEGKVAIGIGTKYPAEVPEILLHEIIEAIYAIRNLRYTKQHAQPDNGDYIFVFDHELFEQSVKDIAAALKGIKF
jgi:hypothetical protein